MNNFITENTPIDLTNHKPKYSKEERQKQFAVATYQEIKYYIKNGSKGDLNLNGAPITKLPDGLKVGGFLNLNGAPIAELPDGLKVSGSLNLYGTPITKLPDGLKVGGYLDLGNTPITKLPDGLKVDGYLNLSDTPLSKKYTKEQLKQMLPGVKKIFTLNNNK